MASSNIYIPYFIFLMIVIIFIYTYLYKQGKSRGRWTDCSGWEKDQGTLKGAFVPTKQTVTAIMNNNNKQQ